MRTAPVLVCVLLAATAASGQPGSSGRARLASGDPAGEPAVRAAAKRALAAVEPSIVEVEALGGIPEAFKAPSNDAEAEKKGVLAKRGFKQAFGPSTGLIVGADGLIATSTLVLNRKPRFLIVTLSDGRSFVATLLGRDDSRAMALLKIDAQDLPVARLAKAKDLRVGRFSLAAGRGLAAARPAVSLGIISGLNRVSGRALQSSAAISPVNYGGPLVGIDGSVLGLLVPLAIRGGMASVDIYDSGIGFAIPAPDLAALLPRLRKKGVRLAAGFLGVGPDSDAKYRGDGVRVAQVAPGSPAAKAKLKEGDVVLKVDGEPVNAVWQLRHALARHYAGDTLKLEVSFQGDKREVEVTLAEPPKQEPGPAVPNMPGGPKKP